MSLAEIIDRARGIAIKEELGVFMRDGCGAREMFSDRQRDGPEIQIDQDSNWPDFGVRGQSAKTIGKSIQDILLVCVVQIASHATGICFRPGEVFLVEIIRHKITSQMHPEPGKSERDKAVLAAEQVCRIDTHRIKSMGGGCERSCHAHALDIRPLASEEQAGPAECGDEKEDTETTTRAPG